MLGLITYGLLCGAPDVKSIWRKCAPLDQNQRRAIGLTRRDKKSRRLKMPGYDALNAWFAAHGDGLPKTLSLDGKDLGAKGKLGGLV